MPNNLTKEQTKKILNSMHSDVQKTTFGNRFSQIDGDFYNQVGAAMYEAGQQKKSETYSREQIRFKEMMEEELMIDEATFHILKEKLPDLEVVKSVQRKKTRLYDTANASGLKKIFKGLSEADIQNARKRIAELERNKRELEYFRIAGGAGGNITSNRYSMDKELVARMREENEYINQFPCESHVQLPAKLKDKHRMLVSKRVFSPQNDEDTVNVYSSVGNRAGDKEVEKVTKEMINFNTMNSALRRGRYKKGNGSNRNCRVEESGLNDEYIEKLHKLIGKNSLPEDMILKRGCTTGDALLFLGISPALIGDNPEYYLLENIDEINNKRIVSDPAFLSTSAFFTIYSFSPAQIVINGKKGDKAIYLEGISSGEFEVLYQRGSKFRLLDIENRNGQWFFYLDSMGQHSEL